jgi:hypothetical protein
MNSVALIFVSTWVGLPRSTGMREVFYIAMEQPMKMNRASRGTLYYVETDIEFIDWGMLRQFETPSSGQKVCQLSIDDACTLLKGHLVDSKACRQDYTC